MDCPRSLVLVIGLAGFSLGCNQNILHTNSSDQVARKDDDLPKRQPKADTCIKFANMREHEAADTKKAPAEQQRCLEEARMLYDQALSIDPKNIDALLGLAALQDKMGSHDKALAIYDRAVK